MRTLSTSILLGILLLPMTMEAKELPCDSTANPVVCAFLNRYVTDLANWNESEVSIIRKMRDDKFIILDGTLDNVALMTDSTLVSINRYDNKGYEVIWQNNEDILLRVAFPIQYELLLGMPQYEIEQLTPSYILRAPTREVDTFINMSMDSIEDNIYRTSPRQHYELQSLNNCRYLYRDTVGQMQYVCDSLHLPYTVANLFQHGLGKDYVMDVKQSTYGFKKLEYVITLQQWLNYCAEQHITSYVAVEEEYEDAIQILVVAECRDLGFNHLLSVLIPRDFLNNSDKHFMVKMNAFIPTHNISNLYEQYKQQPKKERIWEEN